MKRLFALSIVLQLGVGCGISSFKSLNDDPEGADVGDEDDLPASGNLEGEVPSANLENIEKDFVVSNTLFAGCSDPNLVQKIEQNLNFEERKDCSFGMNDNLPIKDRSVTARESQTIETSLPPDSVVCDINLKSAQANLHYDDFLFITLNNDILVASEVGFADLFAPVDGLKPWDWLKLRGQSFDLVQGDKEGITYCLNDEACVMPGHDATGAFSYSVDLEGIPALATKILALGTMSFTAIATGDNDPADCDHSSFNLDLTVEYAPLPK